MSVKRKGGRITISTDDQSAETRAALGEIFRNLAPEAQRSRLSDHLDAALAEGMPSSLYQTIRQELDGGHLKVVKDSLLAWRARESRSHGGRSKLEGIQQAIEIMIKMHPSISNADAWAWFPEAHNPREIETDNADYKIYRDGERLLQVDNFTGAEESISRRAFEDGYLTPARKKHR